MGFTVPSAAELAADLNRVVTARVLDPLEIWLDGGGSVTVRQADAYGMADVWAARLLGSDQADAAHAAVQLIAALYVGDRAFDPPASWWQTPLGRVVAWRLGHPGAETVSYAVAGAMLGITRQGVYDLVKRGKLTVHPDGGVCTASIRSRLDSMVARA